MSFWLNKFSSQMCKYETSRILFFSYIFQQSQAYEGFIPKSQLKSKISHSLIHMGFIGLVTWSEVRGLWKKGLETQRVFEGYIEQEPQECCLYLLGWALLHSSYALIFHFTFVPFLQHLEIFCLSFVYLFFYFLFHCCPTSCMWFPLLFLLV